MTLRDYQVRTSDLVFKEWDDHRSTLMVYPTGCGKTIVFADVIRRMQPRRALVVAHREELIYQAREKIAAVTGLDCEIEMADLSASTNLFNRTPVIVATVQTLIAGTNGYRRMNRFRPQDFGLLVIDECFPAGTLIDGIPIEQINVGQQVKTQRGFGRVLYKFKRQASSICRIEFESGRQLFCTPNHPIWTTRGFVPAELLLTNKSVVATIIHEQVHYLRETNREDAVRQSRLQIAALQKHDSQDILAARGRDYPIPQDKRNARSEGQGDCFNKAPSNGLEASTKGRQWASSDHSRDGSSVGPWLGHECCRDDEGSPSWFSNLLQVGRWEFRFEDWGGDRWQFSLCTGTEGQGQEERGIFAFDRVASVEVYQQGSGEEFERMCPSGLVYNLEVSNGATYFANGVLVHNCHHAVADSYRAVLDYFMANEQLKVLGVTATPDRADEEALGKVFESVADDYEILDAIHDGWLVDIEQLFVPVEGLDFSHIRTTAGDLNGADLSAVMEAENSIQGVVHPTLEAVFDLKAHTLNDIPVEQWTPFLTEHYGAKRRAIVFTASVKQAEMLCNIFNRACPGLAGWVCGNTNKDERRMLLSDFAAGRTSIVCNCGVLTEGFDDPGVELIVMARPTKSRALYAQMCGRSTRPLAGVVDGLESAAQRKAAIAQSPKSKCVVMDFVGNSGRHKLITAADILGGNVSEAAIELSVRKAKERGEARSVTEDLDEAEALIRRQMEEARLAVEARKAKLVAKVKFTAQRVNPFDAFQLQPARDRGWDTGKTLSEKQRALLMRQGIDPDGMNYAAARQLINEMFRRWNNHLCTMKQAACLKRAGYNPKDITIEKAGQLITQLKQNHWKRPNNEDRTDRAEDRQHHHADADESKGVWAD